MPFKVVNGAALACTFGGGPGTLVVPPLHRALAGNQPQATVMDFAPTENISTFGMCMSPSNPQVAAATTAAMGVLTPQPCIPATASPWSPGAVPVALDHQTALDAASVCMCMWGGEISVTQAGQTSVRAP